MKRWLPWMALFFGSGVVMALVGSKKTSPAPSDGEEPQLVWRYVVIDKFGSPVDDVPPFQGVASPEGDLETQIVSSVHPTFEMAQNDIEQIIRDRGGVPQFVGQ